MTKKNDTGAPAHFRLRFVGRFVFACTDNADAPLEITALAANMAFNSDLHSDPHRAFITVPRAFVRSKVSSFAAFSTFGSTREASAEAQLFVWDVAGCDISVQNVRHDAITVANWHAVPDLEKLSGRKFNRDFLSSPFGAKSPVSARVHLKTGRFTPLQFDKGKLVSFEPLQEERPQKRATEPLPDVIDVDLSYEEPHIPLTLALTSFDGTRRSIVVGRTDREQDGPVVIIFSNLCAERGSIGEDDREFAAYYDLMVNGKEEPVPVRLRLVPFADAKPTEGAKADCTGVAKVRS